MLLINKHVSVSRLALLYIDNSLVCILHGTLLNPGLDLLVDSKLEHLGDILGGSDGATADLETAGEESEGVDGG